MESLCDDNLNPDNDEHVHCDRLWMSCCSDSVLAFFFQLICRWKQVVIGHSARTLGVHFAIVVAERYLSRIAERAQEVSSRLESESTAVTLEDSERECGSRTTRCAAG